jgi:Ca2+-binding RTX toxin-like protein
MSLGAVSAQGAVTVGSPLTTPPTGQFGGSTTEINATLGEPGSLLTSPIDGVIVSYRVAVAPTSDGPVSIRAIRPASGDTFTGAGTSTPTEPPGTGLQTLSANVPIRAGDFVGLDLGDGALVQIGSVSGSTIFEWFPRLADGTTRSPDTEYPGLELLFNAQVEPDCDLDGLGDETQDARLSTPPCPTTLTCKGQTATNVGTDGSDEITGTDARDVVVALGGKDEIRGLAGKDLICGGSGRDTLKGGKGKDKLYGQKGKDKLIGGGGKDRCVGGKKDDTAKKCEVEKSI